MIDEKNFIAQARSLKKLVNYQEEAIVSRTILDKKTGSVTLFAFDVNQGLSEHTAPFDALVYVLEGEAEVTISNKPMLLAGGEFTVMPAKAPHSVRAVSRFKMLLVMIRS